MIRFEDEATDDADDAAVLATCDLATAGLAGKEVPTKNLQSAKSDAVINPLPLMSDRKFPAPALWPMLNLIVAISAADTLPLPVTSP